MATTLAYHICGPVLPQCNIGAASAYVTIGECQDGADIQIIPKVHEIKSDGGGGMDGDAVELIQLNATAIIKFKLVPYAGDYLSTLRRMAISSPTEGILPMPGTLFGGNSRLPALYLPYGDASDVDGPWFFPTCQVVIPGNPRVWTKETTPELEFRARVYYNPASITSVYNRTLYTRSTPA